MGQFLVTIVIFAYNHENFIMQTINSVLCQKTTFGFKLIVTDDASTDNTRQRIQYLIEEYPKQIIPVFNERNIGLNNTLKKVLGVLDTKYTCFLGGDDYWIDELKLQKQIDVLESNSDISFVHTGFQYLNDCTNTLGEKIDKWEWSMPQNREDRIVSFLNHEFGSYPCASTSCFRTIPLLNCYRDYPQLLDFGVGEGTLLHTSMCMYGGKYFFLSDITTVYRCRENSLSHFNDEWGMINFQLDYLKLKIITFQLFNIPQEAYRRVVNNCVDKYIVRAYLNKCLNNFKSKIVTLGIDDDILKKHKWILSNKIRTFIYVLYVRCRNKMV